MPLDDSDQKIFKSIDKTLTQLCNNTERIANALESANERNLLIAVNAERKRKGYGPIQSLTDFAQKEGTS
jgi:hypothetical protein